jgi:phosphotransferase system HPr-like phosphotransfer protein
LTQKELQHFKNRTSEVIAPASALRNVLQHFKGQLLLRARNTPKETPNWSIMADRLVITGVSTPEHSTLEGEGAKNSQLYDRLSRILKGNLQATSTDMDNIFIEVTDHIFTVLSLIRL